ncbi:MAG: hypothetical protein QOG30_814, partial [Acidimicrobiaceae bacterium]
MVFASAAPGQAATDPPPPPAVKNYPGIASLSITPVETSLDQPYPLCLGSFYAGNPQSPNFCKQLTLTLTSSLSYCPTYYDVDCISEIDWGHTNGSLPHKSGGPSDVNFIWWPAVAGSSPDCAGGLTPCDRFFIYGANSGMYSDWMVLSNPEIWVRRSGGAYTFYETYTPEAAVYLHAPTSDPTAAFTSAPGANPGDVTFLSSSSNPGGGTLTHDWTFGDGGTAAGSSPTHHYALPGDYDVTLKVTNTSGQTDSVTHKVTVAPPKLGVSIELLGGASPPLDLDQVVQARVTVSASPGYGSLKNLKFDGGALAVSPNDIFEVTAGPTPQPAAGGFTLAPDTETSFDVTLKAVKDGSYTLSSTVNGVDAANKAVHEVATSNGVVATDSVLAITITPEKNDFTIAQEDDGKVKPESIDVTFQVENTSDDPVTDVVAQPSDLAAANVLKPYLNFPASWVGDNDERDLGTLAPHEKKSFTRKLEVSGDGTIAIKQLLVSSDGLSRGRGQLHVLQKLLLKVEAHKAAGSLGMIKAGSSFFVAGSFENLSNDIVLDIPHPLRPLTTGNIGGGYIAEAVGDDVPTPLVKTLDPRDKVDFSVRMRTMRPSAEDFFSGANALPEWTEGNIAFLDPYVEIVHEDQTRSILINSTVSEGTSIDVHIDTSEPPPSDPFRVENAVIGLGGAGLERIQEVLDSYFAVIGNVVLFGVDEQYRTETLGVMARGVEYLYDILHNLGPDDFARLANEVVAKLGPVLTGETGDSIRAAVSAYSDKVQQAWQYGDQAAIFDAARPIGRGVGDFGSTMLLDEAVGRVVVKLLSARSVYREAATFGQIQRQEKIYEKSKSSFVELETYYQGRAPLPREVVERYMTKTEIEQAEALDRAGVQSVAKPNEVAATRLVNAEEATRKGEEIKNKTMAEIERMVFGGGEDVGKVLLRSDMPASEAEVEALFQKALYENPDFLKAEDLAAAKQIWKNRTKEWAGFNSGDLSTEFGRLKQWVEKGKIPFEFQAVENGINLRKNFGYLDFALEPGVDAAGKTIPGYWVLKMRDPITKKMMAISGDVDFLFFLSKNGLSISKDVRESVYNALLPFLTFLHPETGSFATLLKKKLSFLTAHFRDGVPLLTVKDGKWFAVKIDERFSRFRPGTTDQYYLHLSGMPTNFNMLQYLAPFSWAESRAKLPGWLPITALRRAFAPKANGGGGAGGGTG